MRKSFYFLLFTFSVVAASRVLAQDTALFQAARKEGSVVWYTSLALPSSTAIAHAFKTKYTGLDVEVHRTGSQRVLQRVMQEASRRYQQCRCDSHLGCRPLCAAQRTKDMLLQYTPKGVEAFPAGFKDKNGFYFGMRATLSVIAYNPKIVSGKDAPKTWKDLLNSKWKGKRSRPIPVTAVLS